MTTAPSTVLDFDIATPWQFFFACGVVAERSHRYAEVGLAIRSMSRSVHREWVEAAGHRGFTGHKKLREALRVGRITPRGQRLAQDIVSRFEPHELAMLLERARLFHALMADPSPANSYACRNSPRLQHAAR